MLPRRPPGRVIPSRVSLKERVGSWMFREREERLTNMAEVLLRAWETGPYASPPVEVVRRFSEFDPRMADMFTYLSDYEVLSGLESNETYRIEKVKESRYMAMYDNVTKAAIRLWTDFGFGLDIEVMPRDEPLQELFNEFWNAKRNRAILGDRHIHELSEQLLKDGEIYFVFFISHVDGQSTIRTIPTEQIVETITDPDDDKVVLFYRRQWASQGTQTGSLNTAYYQHWTATPEELDRVQLDEAIPIAGRENGVALDGTGTEVLVIPAKHLVENGRGWPLMFSSAAWSRMYRDFLQDRAAVARAVAAYVDKLKIKGGSRTVDRIKEDLQSSLVDSISNYETNPPPAAGSTWTENEQLERSRLSMGTGAGDAQQDGAALIGQAGLGAGIFAHWLGRGEAYRLATATSMETPVFRVFSRYQRFWASVFRDMVELVAWGYETFGSKQKFETLDTDVSTDPLVQSDPNNALALAKTTMEAVGGTLITVEEASMTIRQVIRLVLQLMGVKRVDEIVPAEIPDELTEIWEAPAEEPPPEEPGPEEFPEEPAFPEGELEGLSDEELLAMAGAPETPPEALTAESTRLREAATQTLDRFFAESQADFQTAVRYAIRGLWAGEYNRAGFIGAMTAAIARHLTEAWYEGARMAGVSPDELTDEEVNALQVYILEQSGYVYGLAQAVMDGSRENGGLLRDVTWRASLWANRWNTALDRGQAMALGDPKLKWIYGDTLNHCDDCSNYEGRVYRKSTWNKYGIEPRDPGLACGGYKCGCHREPTDEPCTPGRPPNMVGPRKGKKRGRRR